MVAMLESTEVDGEKISKLIDEGKISKAKLDEIVENEEWWSRNSQIFRKRISLLCSCSIRR